MNLTQKQLRARGLAKIVRHMVGCKIESGDGTDGGGAVSTGEEAKGDGSGEQQQEQQAQGGTGQQPDSATLGTDVKAANSDPAAGEQQQEQQT